MMTHPSGSWATALGSLTEGLKREIGSVFLMRDLFFAA
jgi:hypothetical protein